MASYVCMLCFISIVSAENVWKGTWYNGLGSVAHLNVHPDNEISGEYWTGVESEQGSSGGNISTLKGYLLEDDSLLAGFSVVWSNGLSVTSWIAQLAEQGKEEITSTWVLRRKVDNCKDLWRSLTINQDIFTRDKKLEGWRTASVLDRQTTSSGSACSMEGTWYAKDGSELKLEENDGSLKGTLSLKDRYSMTMQGTHFKIHGQAGHLEQTLGFTARELYSRAIVTFTGQCIKCENSDTLHLSYLAAISDREGHSPVFGTLAMKRTPPVKTEVVVRKESLLMKVWRTITRGIKFW